MSNHPSSDHIKDAEDRVKRGYEKATGNKPSHRDLELLTSRQIKHYYRVGSNKQRAKKRKLLYSALLVFTVLAGTLAYLYLKQANEEYDTSKSVGFLESDTSFSVKKTPGADDPANPNSSSSPSTTGGQQGTSNQSSSAEQQSSSNQSGSSNQPSSNTSTAAPQPTTTVITGWQAVSSSPDQCSSSSQGDRIYCAPGRIGTFYISTTKGTTIKDYWEIHGLDRGAMNGVSVTYRLLSSSQLQVQVTSNRTYDPFIVHVNIAVNESASPQQQTTLGLGLWFTYKAGCLASPPVSGCAR